MEITKHTHPVLFKAIDSQFSKNHNPSRMTLDGETWERRTDNETIIYQRIPGGGNIDARYGGRSSFS